jgi:hypothetical protein
MDIIGGKREGPDYVSCHQGTFFCFCITLFDFGSFESMFLDFSERT